MEEPSARDSTESLRAKLEGWLATQRDGLAPFRGAPEGAIAQAGRAALLAAKHVTQVCGAIGWTWEHRIHRFVRRAHLLDGLLGSAAEATSRVGAELMRTRSIARLDGF